MKFRYERFSFFVVGLACLVFSSCAPRRNVDEATWILENVGEEAVPQEKGTFYPTHPHDAFKGMDSHVKDVYNHDFSKDEILGRNTWVMWSGGNQEFWDYTARYSNGIVDLLRLCDSRFVSRKDRFRIMGLVPHPGMKETSPSQPLGNPSESNNYGLHIDTYDNYSGEYGAYVEGERPDPKVYGYASGIVGLRLFPRAEDPNPRIRKEWEQNRHKWDPNRYISDESYYKDPKLIRPFRVGMSCGFCHINANPMNPPEDMSKPYWKNLSSNIGNQYFWFGRIFGSDFKRDNALYSLLNYPEPGTLDTSLVATDGNNNPNTMNSVYQLLPRVIVSLKSPAELQSADTLAHMPRLDQGYSFQARRVVEGPQTGPNDTQPMLFNSNENDFLTYLALGDPFIDPSSLPNGLEKLPPLLGTDSQGRPDPTRRHTPKILAGGADSIGGRGALCRVYKNIGEYSSEWVTLSNIMVGVRKQEPFKMQKAAENSLNWHVTMRRSTNVGKYFLAGSVPMRLEDAIQSKIENDGAKTTAMKEAYATNYGSMPEYNNHVTESGQFKDKYENYVKDNDQLLEGAAVFARDCFVCHSSIGQPEGFWSEPGNWKKWIQQPGYVDNATKFLQGLLKEEVTDWSQPSDAPTPDDGAPADTATEETTTRSLAGSASQLNNRPAKNDPFFEKFVKTNYLSTDARYHVSEIGTNSGRSLADNAGSDERMWADYSSRDFKAQEKLATPIEIAHPYDPDSRINWPLNTEAGPGNYRPQSLSSMWAHGPYLHNNSVGYYPYEYGPDPRAGMEGLSLSTFADDIQSIETRIEIFEDGTRRLLGLPSEPDYNAAKYRGYRKDKPRRLFDSIVRFEKNSELILPAVVIPNLIEMQSLALFGFGIPIWVQLLFLLLVFAVGVWLFVKGVTRAREGRGLLLRNLAAFAIGLVLIVGVIWLTQKKEYRIGHIPKGTPVNLIACINGPEWATGTKERKQLLAKALIGLKKADKYKVASLQDRRLNVGGQPLFEILMALSKCPDLELDRGHEFGMYETPAMATGIKRQVSVAEREALIEFLKKL